MLETPKALSTHKVTNEEITMDNQQEIKAAYLAGIMDGEGYVSLHVNQHKKCNRGNPRPQITPRIAIGSTSSEIIEKCVDIIHALGVGCLVKERTLKSSKLFQTIHIVGMKRVGTLLPKILHHLTLKSHNAKLILEFIQSRMSKEMNVTYNEYELGLVDACKQRSSETTRETLAA